MKYDVKNALIQSYLALHFFLILCIAGLTMFDYVEAVSILIDLNMMFVGFYFLFCIHKNTHLISKTSFICISLAILLVQLQNINFPAVFQINVGILFLHLMVLLWKKDTDSARVIACIFVLPTLLTILDMFISEEIRASFYARNTWDAAYIAAGIWLIGRAMTTRLSKIVPNLIFVVLLVYTFFLIQLPIGSFVTMKPLKFFGVNLNTSNIVFTSHICIFTALAFLLAIYQFMRFPWRLKIFFLPVLIPLFLFILYTSWRPVWLGLIIGLLIATSFCYKQHKTLIISVLLLSQAILLSTNLGQYRDRIVGLVTQSSSEERAVIWQDAWQMQLASSNDKWLTGHGLMSFEEDFKQYSRFYLHPELIPAPPIPPRHLWVFSQIVNDYLIDFRIYSSYWNEHIARKNFTNPTIFRSPHNVVLDLLYSVGLFGLIAIGGAFLFLTQYLIKLSRFNRNSRLLACITIAALVSNAIVNGLNFPFFVHYNLLPLAFIGGVTLYIRETSQCDKYER